MGSWPEPYSKIQRSVCYHIECAYKPNQFIIKSVRQVGHYNIDLMVTIRPTLIATIALLDLIFDSSQTTSEVSSFNLLLPTSYHQTKGRARQIVITSGNCYDWESSDPQVVQVKGTHQGLVPSETASQNPQCLSNGIVELVQKGAHQSTVHIMAREQESTGMVRIPVRIRDLKRIAIFTKSRIMNVEEVQNLELYGFDAENNTFTSLEGLRFKWTISRANGAEKPSSAGAVEKIPLKSSSLYMPLDTRKRLEAQEGVESDLLVIRALHVGKVAVEVACLEQDYELISEKITLYIQEKFEIKPDRLVHLLAGSRFQYTLVSPSGLHIGLPSSYYQIDLSSLQFLVSKKLLVTAPITDRSTLLTVSDDRTSPPFTQSVQVFSHQPDEIEILVAEQIVIGQKTNYSLNFYYKKMVLEGVPNSAILKIKALSPEGNSPFILNDQELTGVSKGTGLLAVEYNGFQSEKRIEVVTPLKVISPRNIVLPVGEIYHLNVIGGSGRYRYSYAQNSHQQIIAFSSEGTLISQRQGTATIHITDQKSEDNGLALKIQVIQMAHLFSLEEHKQLNILEDGSLYIGAGVSKEVQGGAGLTNGYFTQCNDAFLKNLSLEPSPRSAAPLKIVSVNPLTHQVKEWLKLQASANKHLQKLLQQRALINPQLLLKQYQLYLKFNEIKLPQLETLINGMENYGLCLKVVVKPVAVYDGDITLSLKSPDGKALSIPAPTKLRVYDTLRTLIPGLTAQPLNSSTQITVTPLGSFMWETTGGPYKWDVSMFGATKVYLNAVGLNQSSKRYQNNQPYPLITCPIVERPTTVYLLKYQNPESIYLVKPVEQHVQITVNCMLPKFIRFRLLHQQEPPNQEDQRPPQFQYISDKHSNSTVYIYPNQGFIVSLQPVLSKPGHSYIQQYPEFYNSSNIHYELTGCNFGKLEEVPQRTDPSNPHTWNTRQIQYHTKYRQEDHTFNNDSILIQATKVRDITTGQAVELPTPLSHKINIATIPPLKFKNDPTHIELPNHPLNQYTLELENVGDHRRFSVICDSKCVKCRKTNDSIILSPRNVDRFERCHVGAIDQYVLGRPQITLPVQVIPISGIDLRVSRAKRLSNNQVEIPKEDLSTDTWVFSGQLFIATLDVYSYSYGEASGSQRTSERRAIKNINHNIVQLTVERGERLQHGHVTEILKRYDSDNEVVLVLYKTPHILEGQSDRESPGSNSVSIQITASIKYKNIRPLFSNTATVRMYNLISLRGPGVVSLKLSQTTDQSRAGFESMVSVMESCSTVLEVQGGPPNLRTKVISNPGQGVYFNANKIGERLYQIQTILSTLEIDSKEKEVSIKGNEKNLFSLIAYVGEDGEKGTLRSLHCLITVTDIKNLQVVGNDMLLVGSEVRYLASFDQLISQQLSQRSMKTCSLKYKWDVVSSAQNSPIILASDPQKIGVNVTTNPTLVPSNNEPIADSLVQLSVAIYNKLNQQIGKAAKQVTVLAEYQMHFTGVPSTNNIKGIIINNEKLLLMPPHSEVILNRNTYISTVAPCNREDPTIKVVGDHQLVSGESSNQPQLIKLQIRAQSRDRETPVLPTFINVLVTQICGVVVHNIDGSITVNPGLSDGRKREAGTTSAHVVKFSVTDCYGRKFQNYNFKNVEYKVTVLDTNIARAQIYDRDEGLISLQGYDIGHSLLILQVKSHNAVKAKDIVPIYVDAQIEPSHPFSIIVGDLVSFRAVSRVSSSLGNWVSLHPNIVKISEKTGEAVALSEGETEIKIGFTSTKVSVAQYSDLVKSNGRARRSSEVKGNQYEYEVLFSGKSFPFLEDHKYVKKQRSWGCAVVGKQVQHLSCSAQQFKSDQKEYVRCSVKMTPRSSSSNPPSFKTFKLNVAASTHGQVLFSKEFQEELSMFVVLSEMTINPQDPRFTKEKSPYLIVIETPEMLEVHQEGGEDNWIVSNQFHGIRQIVSLDLSKTRGAWVVSLFNPRTMQLERVTISPHVPPGDRKPEGKEGSGKQMAKEEWKWIDILVIFMAINFLVILGYQMCLKSNNFMDHFKTH